MPSQEEANPTSDLQTRPRLIRERPSSEDRFRNRAHARLASAISGLLYDEEGGAVIGLDGPRGSGKSTVINLIQAHPGNDLGPDQEWEIFVFDAWLHQGDAMRKALVEEFGLWANERKYLPDEEWKKITLGMQPNVEVKHVDKRMALSSMEQLGIISLYLAPVLIAWMSPFGYRLLSEGAIDRNIFLGVTLLWLLPVIWAGSWLAGQPLRSRFDWLREHWADPFRFFKRDGDEAVFTETIQRPDVTAVKLKARLSEIFSHCGKGKKQLLFVIDNIDRLDPESAGEVWASLPNIVQAYEESQNKDSVKTQFLVPFSMADEKEDVEELEDRNQKVFSAVYRVPPPLVSDWQDYFVLQLNEMFGESRFSSHEVRQFVALTDHFSATNNKPITARYLNGLLNRFAVMLPTLPPGVSAPTAFCFLFVERELEQSSGPEMLAKGTLLNDYVQDLLRDSNWVAVFSAIHHGVEQDAANEVLLGNKVRRCLEGVEGIELNEWIASPALDPCVRAYFENVLRQGEVGTAFFAPACAFLDFASDLEEAPDWVDAQLRTLAEYASREEVAGSWPSSLSYSAQTLPRLAVLMDSSAKTRVAEAVVNSELALAGGAEDMRAASDVVLLSAGVVRGENLQRRRQDKKIIGIRIPEERDFDLKVRAAARRQSYPTSWFRYDRDAGKQIKRIAEAIASDELESVLFHATTGMASTTSGSEHWKTVADQIVDKISSDEEPSASTIFDHLRILEFLSGAGRVAGAAGKESLEKLVVSGPLLSVAGWANENDHEELCAKALAVCLAFGSDMTTSVPDHSQFGNFNVGLELIRSIEEVDLEVAPQFHKHPFLDRYLENLPVENIAGEALRKIAATVLVRREYSSGAVETIFDAMPTLIPVLDQSTLSELIQAVSASGHIDMLRRWIGETGFNNLTRAILDGVLSAPEHHRKKLLDAALERLAGLDRDSWVSLVETQMHMFMWPAEGVRSGIKFTPKSYEIKEALKVCLQHVATAKVELSDLLPNLETMCRWLDSKPFEGEVLRQIYDLIPTVTELRLRCDLVDFSLSVTDKEAVDAALLQVLANHIVIPAIGDRDPRGLKWVLSQGEAVRRLRDADEVVRQTIVRTAQDSFADCADPEREAINEVLVGIGEDALDLEPIEEGTNEEASKES